ncbi:MAG: hypothetical protein GEU83_00295 [Pseudonocardiaceae bacterium]|nr:hypothetical protein [Pseudonocardiaceae bacterium]
MHPAARWSGLLGADRSPPRVVEPEPAARPEPTTESDGGGLAYYDNCSAARSAGAAPLYAGDSGYRSGLDRDDDGVACES